MIAQHQPLALSPRQPLNGQKMLRIHRLDHRTHDSGDCKRLKVCTVNVGTTRGRSHEIALMLERREADICCIQEVRYKSNSTTTISAGGNKYMFWYSSSSTGANGVGILLKHELVDSVIGVDRFGDHMMRIKMVLGMVVYHIFSVYPPQVGRPSEEKEDFRETLEDAISSISDREGIIVAFDFNSHLGTVNSGYKDMVQT